MTDPLVPVTISAPGFFGLNWQDSSVDLPPGFSQTADNCIIDQYGRLGSRKGWQPLHTTNASLATSPKAACELIPISGTTYYKIVCGSNKIFSLSGTTLTEITYGGGGAAPTISNDLWSIATLNGRMYLFQASHDPLVFDPAVSTTQYKRISEATGYTGTVQQANIVISAHGRLWTASWTNDKATVQWSDLLAGHVWATGGTSTAGSLNVSSVWPSGADEITALAAHNGYLFIFGKRQIISYTRMDAPTSPYFGLADTIVGVGCVARDSVQAIGTDLLFLSGSGVRTMARSIQNNSLPINDVSKNIRDHLVGDTMNDVAAGSDNIKSIYSDTNSFYVLSLPLTGESYCFDTRNPNQDGSFRVTNWTIAPTCFAVWRDKTLAMGMTGYLGYYTGYIDNASFYTMSYYSNYMVLGNPDTQSIMKKISMTTIGGSNQVISVSYAFDFSTSYQTYQVNLPSLNISQYNISEYGIGVYASGISLNNTPINIGGTGKVFQVGFDATINGNQLSYQRIDIFSKNGKLVP
jgi:hypothetical protein